MNIMSNTKQLTPNQEKISTERTRKYFTKINSSNHFALYVL